MVPNPLELIVELPAELPEPDELAPGDEVAVPVLLLSACFVLVTR